ncbi:MAG: hypothetical protein AAGK14_05535 [Verrucomicrobiota bacterium]
MKPTALSVVLLAALLCSALPALAGLGQSAEEITKTFGPAKSHDQEASTMTWELEDGIVYTVAFDGAGKSWLEQVALANDDGEDAFKSVGLLRKFANQHFGSEDAWEFVDSLEPATFGDRKLESVHGVIYWRLSKDGKQASAMHVSGTPLIGVINADYAKANPKAPIFAGY